MTQERKILTLKLSNESEDQNDKSGTTEAAVVTQDADTQPKVKKDPESKPAKKKFYKAKKKKVVKGPTPAKSPGQRIKESKAVITTLCEKFPLCFHEKDLKPLKLGILEDLFTEVPQEQFSKKALMRALNVYTVRMRYLKILLEHDQRYDLHGNVSGKVTPEQKQIAQSLLDQMKQRQAQRAEEKKISANKIPSHDGKIGREWQS